MKYIKPILFLILMGLSVSSFFFLPKLIKIKTIECKSQYGECGVYFKEKMESLAGGTLPAVESKIKTFLKNEESIGDFSLQFRLPNKILVNLIEKKPKFALKTADKSTFALIDKNGVVIRIEDSTNLPYIEISETYPPSQKSFLLRRDFAPYEARGEDAPSVSSRELHPNVGQKVSDKQLFALNLIYDIFSSYQVQKGRIENDSLIIDRIGSQTIIFPLEGDKEALMGALTLILTKLKETAKDSRINIREIDLRFKNPVLK